MWWQSEGWKNWVRVFEKNRTDLAPRKIAADWLDELGCDYAAGRAKLLREHSQYQRRTSTIEAFVRFDEQTKRYAIELSSHVSHVRHSPECIRVFMETFNAMPRNHPLWRARMFSFRCGSVHSVMWDAWSFNNLVVAPVMASEEVRKVSLAGITPILRDETHTPPGDMTWSECSADNAEFGTYEIPDGRLRIMASLLPSMFSQDQRSATVLRALRAGINLAELAFYLHQGLIPQCINYVSDTAGTHGHNLDEAVTDAVSLYRMTFRNAFVLARKWAGLQVIPPMRTTLSDIADLTLFNHYWREGMRTILEKREIL